MRYFLFVVLAMALMGCLQSIYPLFHEKDLVFDENLLGSWSKGENTWTFEKTVSTRSVKRPENAYLLTAREGDDVKLFQAHLGFIGEYAFLDMFLDREPEASLPLHFIYRIVVERDSLRLAILGEEWRRALADSEKEKLRIGVFGHQEVALAPTDVLQAVLRAHYRDDPKTFVDANVMVRYRR